MPKEDVGKKASYPQVVTGFNMTRGSYLILFSLVPVVSGYFALRSSWWLPETGALEEPVAILPVIPAHIILPSNSEEDYVKMAEKTNSVLNRLAGSNNSKLLGPKKVRKLLNKSDLESLYGILDKPGDHARKTKSKKLAEMSKRLEVRKIIRVKVEILRPHAYMEKQNPRSLTNRPKHWSGWADVSADLLGISPPQLIVTRTNHKRSWGETGVSDVTMGPLVGPICLAWPYDAYKRSERRALAQAAKEAIAGVLKKSTWDGWIE